MSPTAAFTYRNRTGYDNAHDQPVDGHRFAHDDRNQILRSNTRGFDTTTQYAHTRGKDAPRRMLM